MGKYDPATRRGINWCLKSGPGMTNSQANSRNLHFGIDAGSEPFAVSAALSCTVLPALADVTTPCAASWISVANEPGLTLPTVRTSQEPGVFDL